MIIKNKKQLSTTGLRSKVLDIIEAGINRVLPSEVVREAVDFDPKTKILKIQGDTHDLSSGRLFVLGGGKASGLMAETLESILPPGIICAGLINAPKGKYRTKAVKINPAGFPIPDQRGILGVQKMLALKERFQISHNDVVLCLISGGGSALMPDCVKGTSLEDIQKTTDLLIKSGAKIYEINKIRKHISLIKGGGFAQHFAPAKILALIVSDVIGDDLDVIASGLTAPDQSTFKDALEVLKTYGILSRVPKNVRRYLEKGEKGEIAETPKTVLNSYNYIIANNQLALEAMSSQAQQQGMQPCVITTPLTGDPEFMANLRSRQLTAQKFSEHNCLIIGGETTPAVPQKHGIGGRNQHYIAATLLSLGQFRKDWVVASVGTDGTDFLSGAAGAIIDRRSFSKARKLNIRAYLDDYDSYNLLKKIGNTHIITGNTGTNVGDIVVYAWQRER